MQDIENFSGRIRDEIVLAEPGLIPICRRDVGYFEFEGVMWDDKTWSKPVQCTFPVRIWDWLKKTMAMA